MTKAIHRGNASHNIFRPQFCQHQTWQH